MKKVLQATVHKGSLLVHDKWLATEKAVRELGFASAPSVNHAKGYREIESCWHSNDIEAWRLWLCIGALRSGVLQCTCPPC